MGYRELAKRGGQWVAIGTVMGERVEGYGGTSTLLDYIAATSRGFRCVDCGRSLESGVSYSEIAFLRLTHPDIEGEGLLCLDCLDIREGK